jgi:hypothetical protein
VEKKAAKPEQPPLTAIRSGAGRGRSPLPGRVTAGVAVASVLFAAAMQLVMRPDMEVGGRRLTLPAFAKDARPQPLQLPMPPARVEPIRAAPAVPAAPEVKPKPPLPAVSAKPARRAAKARAPKPAPMPKDAGPQWVFEGTAYDLITLRPVYAATLTFKDASGSVCGETTTGEDGSYSIALDPLSDAGYFLVVNHADFQEKYIDEINPPFKEVPLEERRQLASMTARARPWLGTTTLAVRRDFVMIPKDPGQADKGGPESPAPAVPSQ